MMKLLPKTKWQWVRLAALAIVAAGIFLIFLGLPFISYSLYEPQVGDVVFQSFLPVGIVRAIEGATHSPFSHCGAVVKEKGEWYVIEALGEVRLTPLYSWVKQGRFGKFAAYRLKPEFRKHIPGFEREMRKYLGVPYDFRYRMSDYAIYCSELVYKGFKNATGEELGELVTLGELDWKPHKKLIEKLEGGPAPLDRIMITPRHLSEAKQLEKVFGFGF
jgi:hypothetical protein